MRIKLACSVILTYLFFSCNTPTTNTGVYNIEDYGAIGDSVTLNTQAIQDAIDAATEAGGGRVVVPNGVFLTGTFFIKDNVTFEVSSGAKILGSPNLDDYTPINWGHNKDRQPYHLVMIMDAKNVEVNGGGTIDGNGPAFWKERDKSKDPQWIMAQDQKISPMFEVKNSSDVRIKDVNLLTGGGWTVHLYDSDHIQIQGAKILNNVFAPNGDGIDISGCRDVTISDCIIKTCDDAICLKTMVDTKECKRVTVTNCIIECSCAALKIGNETFRDISQVTFSNCVIYNSSRAFAIYSESAGHIEDIIVSNIVTDSKAPLLYNRPIHLSLYLPEPGAGGRNGDWMYEEKKQWDYEGKEPTLKNVQINNFICKTGGRILMTAEDGRYIENLTLRDIYMDYPWIEDPEPNVDKVKSSQFAPVKREAKIATAAVVAENIKNFVFDNIITTFPEDSAEIPDEWYFKKKIANGTLDPFFPEKGKAKQTEFNAVYGRGLVNGVINAPLAKASTPKLKAFDLSGSENVEIK